MTGQAEDVWSESQGSFGSLARRRTIRGFRSIVVFPSEMLDQDSDVVSRSHVDAQIGMLAKNLANAENSSPHGHEHGVFDCLSQLPSPSLMLSRFLFHQGLWPRG